MNKLSLSHRVFVLILALSMFSCGSDKKNGASQSLVRVDGQEITALQVNGELLSRQSQSTPEAQKAIRTQVLEALIDRQLLLNEAITNKLDRDPKVMQTIERAKAQILAQAYLQARVTNVVQPTKTEIEDYFTRHPEFFTERKSFDVQQLVIASKDFSAPLRTLIDNKVALDDVAVWLEGNKIQYARDQVIRTTADLPPSLATKLQGMKKNQILVIRENDNSLLVGLNDIKESPVSAKVAARQIEQYLRNQKSQDAANAELKRLRSIAKLEYLNKAKGEKDKAVSAVASLAVPTTSTATDGSLNADNVARGVAGLK